MERNLFHSDRGGRGLTLFAAAFLAAAAFARAPSAAPPLRDAPPAWYDRDRENIPKPAERAPNLHWDMYETTVLRPVSRFLKPERNLRRLGGEPAPPAANVNALDEVPNGSWFENRIGLFPMTPEAAARGGCEGGGPSREEVWTVIAAKTMGVTPGFNIRDARGNVYVIKFDPPGARGMTVAAGVIAARIFRAAGYHVPEDGAVTFRRDDLRVGEEASIRLPDGTKRPMTEADLDAVLHRVDPLADGSWPALASRFLEGEPLGPFDYRGVRRDDPNDRIPHEHRRELRGLRLFAAWLNHFDTKQENTLDMYVEDGGRRYVRHHLIDFASSLGAGGRGPEPAFGFEYGFDLPETMTRLVTLGFYESPWRTLRREPGLPEIGYFENALFDPERWHPLTPNSAFTNMTDRDGYWAAKIISAFTDEHLEAIVAEGRYPSPEEAAYMVRTLAGRRDLIARNWFDKIPPVDFFAFDGGAFSFRDLGVERGIYPAGARYLVRLAAVDVGRRPGAESPWMTTGRLRFPLDRIPFASVLDRADAARYPFLSFTVRVDRGDGWSRPVTAYAARKSGRVVALER